MSLVISHNFAASYAARQLEINDDNLRNSLNKLSSGKRIVRPTDDAAGMAVQLKMKAAINRGFAAKNNIQNAISLLQTQDGVLTSATSVVDRIGDLVLLLPTHLRPWRRMGSTSFSPRSKVIVAVHPALHLLDYT